MVGPSGFWPFVGTGLYEQASVQYFKVILCVLVLRVDNLLGFMPDQSTLQNPLYCLRLLEAPCISSQVFWSYSPVSAVHTFLCVFAHFTSSQDLYINFLCGSLWPLFAGWWIIWSDHFSVVLCCFLSHCLRVSLHSPLSRSPGNLDKSDMVLSQWQDWVRLQAGLAQIRCLVFWDKYWSTCLACCKCTGLALVLVGEGLGTL